MVSGVDNPALVPDEPIPAAPPEAPAEKPGWQTTEFWLTLIALIVGALLSSGAVQEGTTLYQAITFAAVILSALGYTVSRSIVKKAAQDSAGKAAEAYRANLHASYVHRLRQ